MKVMEGDQYPGIQDEKSGPPWFAGFFTAALILAAAAHLFFFEMFSLVPSSKDFRHEKGVAFLGSILDSSQMTQMSFAKPSAETEPAPFSKYVPPRSEEEYFQALKDISKPKAGAAGRKKDVKSLFLVSQTPQVKNAPRWEAEDVPGYQSLKFNGSPE